MCKLLYEYFVFFCYSVMQPATVLVYVILFCDICGVSVLGVSTIIIAIFIYVFFNTKMFVYSYLHTLSYRHWPVLSERFCTDDISCTPVCCICGVKCGSLFLTVPYLTVISPG